MNQLKKVFVITSEEDHFWLSCSIIESAFKENLKNHPSISWINSKGPLKKEDLDLIYETQKESEIGLYILSDNIHYEELITELLPFKNITYILPIYGNMTIEITRWPNLHKLLQGKKVIFLGSSHRLCQQLHLFVKGGTILKCPYPIHEKHFRKITPRDDQEIKLIYAGRITPQKNILHAMKVFNLARKDSPKLKFHIAGDFHDRGYHFHGLEFDINEFKKDFQTEIENSEGSIIYHGLLGQDELMKLNGECDYAFSMSTYHDEDFGVSIAQALAQGLAPILSDWGGHPEYLKIISGHRIPVELDENNVPDVSGKILYMTLIGLGKIDQEVRTDNQKKIKAYLGKDAFLKRFENILTTDAQTYQGQTDLYLTYAGISLKWRPFAKSLGDQGVDYLSIYRSYLEDYKI